jgi:hypothetical protein
MNATLDFIPLPPFFSLYRVSRNSESSVDEPEGYKEKKVPVAAPNRSTR